jgi:hypothetical protein
MIFGFSLKIGLGGAHRFLPLAFSTIRRAARGAKPGGLIFLQSKKIRKEVIQLLLPEQLPCYDLTPIADDDLFRRYVGVQSSSTLLA